MNPSISFLVLFLALAALAACGSEATDDAPIDLEPPAECVLGEVSDDWQYPAGPYGQDVGDILEDFRLQNCDGEDVRFSDILSQAELVLFNIGAGWCLPCIEETETLDGEIFREHCPRGLRVVQVLFEDEQSRPSTSLFCQNWREGFGLSFPVLKDPLFTTSKYFESVQSQTPINFLVAPNGEIVFKSTGAPPNDLAQIIDQMLPTR